MKKRDSKHFRGCLIGGAIGDALGWPVEFVRLDEIKKKYGQEGILQLAIKLNGRAEITDDTQMTLFTAEGIIRSREGREINGPASPAISVYQAYQRWMLTQGYPRHPAFEAFYDGWLLYIDQLHRTRAPGNSCISALRSGKMGTIAHPINDSKGCGGVMRMAPVGLSFEKNQAFDLGCDIAAQTHGHPSGYLSAGAFAYLIALIIEGRSIEDAARKTLEKLMLYKDHLECTTALGKAITLAESDLPDIDVIQMLGEGWVGEEALALSVYCAIKHQDNFKNALVAAVNHSGDSDSTGALTGNILGAFWGIEIIPTEWIETVELQNTILEVADELLACDPES